VLRIGFTHLFQCLRVSRKCSFNHFYETIKYKTIKEIETICLNNIEFIIEIILLKCLIYYNIKKEKYIYKINHITEKIKINYIYNINNNIFIICISININLNEFIIDDLFFYINYKKYFCVYPFYNLIIKLINNKLYGNINYFKCNFKYNFNLIYNLFYFYLINNFICFQDSINF
jgi:hypothetical protein